MLGIILLACITDYKTEKIELDQYVDTTGGVTSGGNTNGGTTGGSGNENDIDSDGDGYGDILVSGDIAGGSDCNDSDATSFPNADELCSTNEDDDCDGVINEDSAIDVTLFYQDADSDGYGVELYTKGACTLPAGYAEQQGDDWDCDDNDSGFLPSIGAVSTLLILLLASIVIRKK